jgi:hypothetical protein
MPAALSDHDESGFIFVGASPLARYEAIMLALVRDRELIAALLLPVRPIGR